MTEQTYGQTAIATRYCEPTDNRGAHIVVRYGTVRLEVSWDYELDPWTNHARAVRAVINWLGWGDRRWVGGWLPGEGTVWVQVPKSGETP